MSKEIEKSIRLNQIDRINELTDLKNKSNIANMIIADFLKKSKKCGVLLLSKECILESFDRDLTQQVNNALKLLVQNKILVEVENDSVSLNSEYLFKTLDI